MTIQEIVVKKLKLYAKRRAVTLLDGNYDSVFKGKGVELDSLRPYDINDSIKDIDWKSTARTGQVHTRLYSPLRDQRIMIVLDTSASMNVPSMTGMNKKDAAFGIAATLGMFVSRNRDMLSVCTGTPNGDIDIGRFGYTNKHIEKILRDMDSSIQRSITGSPPSIKEMLDRVQRKLKQRTALFIITDDTDNHTNTKIILNKLGTKHQLFWIHLGSSSPFVKQLPYGQQVIDAETKKHISENIVFSQKLSDEWVGHLEALSKYRRKICKSTGTAYGEINSIEQLLPELRKIFVEAKKYARKH